MSESGLRIVGSIELTPEPSENRGVPNSATATTDAVDSLVRCAIEYAEFSKSKVCVAHIVAGKMAAEFIALHVKLLQAVEGLESKLAKPIEYSE